MWLRFCHACRYHTQWRLRGVDDRSAYRPSARPCFTAIVHGVKFALIAAVEAFAPGLLGGAMVSPIISEPSFQVDRDRLTSLFQVA